MELTEKLVELSLIFLHFVLLGAFFKKFDVVSVISFFLCHTLKALQGVLSIYGICAFYIAGTLNL